MRNGVLILRKPTCQPPQPRELRLQNWTLELSRTETQTQHRCKILRNVAVMFRRASQRIHFDDDLKLFFLINTITSQSQPRNRKTRIGHARIQDTEWHAH